MDFEWDPAKALQNFRKHGVRFETAVLAFEDPHAVLLRDDASEMEERWILLGMIPSGRVLVVVHTVRDEETVGIVSARRADSQERMFYGGH